MRFAIALLALVGIAAVAGTILPQGQPFARYVDQFGPFWAEVFARAGLYQVYGAGWFLSILAVLVISTSLCIYRTAPRLLKDWRSFKDQLKVRSLRAMAHHASAQLPGQPESLARQAARHLAGRGWRVRLRPHSAGWLVAAQKGGARKLGYVAAHGAIVLVCLGGLLDGDLALRATMWLRGVTTYTGSGLVSAVPAGHRLPLGNPSYRGVVSVAEGTQSTTALLDRPGGVVLQPLPFSIELKRFIVDYYPTGMPKLFASEVVLHDRSTGEQHAARIEVNHPASYKGVQIYQSSFEDGGSRVRLRAIPLAAPERAFDIQGQVGRDQPLALPAGLAFAGHDGPLTLELTGLRVMNVEPVRHQPSAATEAGQNPDVRAVDPRQLGHAGEAPLAIAGMPLGAAARLDGDKRFQNIGPSISYNLRDGAGQAREYVNYMQPLDLGDALPVYLYGVRPKPNADFAYLKVPVDLALDGVPGSGGGQEDFWRLYAALKDPTLRARAVRQYVQLAAAPGNRQSLRELEATATRLLSLFAGTGDASARGLTAISGLLQHQVPAEQQARATQALAQVLSGVLFQLLQSARVSAGLAALPQATGEQAQQADSYMRLALLGLNDALLYPAPVALALDDFDQVQASIFQVTRAPGTTLVYLGCLLLVLGVFGMLYVRERRFWYWAGPIDEDHATNQQSAPAGEYSQIELALSSNRRTLDADSEFDTLKQVLLGPLQTPGPVVPTPRDSALPRV